MYHPDSVVDPQKKILKKREFRISASMICATQQAQKNAAEKLGSFMAQVM